MTAHAWAPHAESGLPVGRVGRAGLWPRCRPCTRLLRQLTGAISVRAAYAFGDWPPGETLSQWSQAFVELAQSDPLLARTLDGDR